MNPLLVVFPYHNGDIEIARKALKWIAELGSCKPHSLLLCADSTVPRDQVLELMDIARPNFENTRTILITIPAPSSDKKMWPPNVMFLNAAREVMDMFKFNFLWLEPDAIPMYAGWLDDIAEEYERCPYLYMGSIIHQQGQEGMPLEYLNGVAVYPCGAFLVFDKIASVKDSSQAFDIGSASVVVRKSMNTKLIQHYYGTKELPPVFVETRAPDSPKNHVTLDFIRKETAIFHRSKGGELINLLRAKRQNENPANRRTNPSQETKRGFNGEGETEKVEGQEGKTIPSELPQELPPSAQEQDKQNVSRSKETTGGEIKGKNLRDTKGRSETVLRP